MYYYWLLLLVVLQSFLTIVMASQYAMAAKHQFDEDYKPKFYINEWMVYMVGAVLGSLGLLASYITFKDIRQDDAFNHRRFLWISLGMLAIHVGVVVALFLTGVVYVNPPA